MNKILLTLILGIFLISFASAEIQTLGTFKQGEEISLIQTCASCTFNNITSVVQVSPSSREVIGTFEMTKTGSLYNFTLSSGNTSINGRYIVNGIGDLEGVNAIWNYDFFITSFGTNVSDSGILYASLLFIVFFMDLLIFLLIFRLRSENFRNNEGTFIGVSLTKYVRMVLIGVSYGLILITLNLMNAAAATTSQISQFAGIIGGIFLAMLSVAWVWTFIIIIWIGWTAWTDSNFIKEFKRKLEEAGNSIQ